jgi:hypothetical protein
MAITEEPAYVCSGYECPWKETCCLYFVNQMPTDACVTDEFWNNYAEDRFSYFDHEAGDCREFIEVEDAP